MAEQLPHVRVRVLQVRILHPLHGLTSSSSSLTTANPHGRREVRTNARGAKNGEEDQREGGGEEAKKSGGGGKKNRFFFFLFFLWGEVEVLMLEK